MKSLSGVDTILEEIRGLRNDVRADQNKMWEAIEEGRKCRTVMKIEQMKINGEIEKLKLEKTMGEQAFLRHIENKEKHYNPYYSETYWETMGRKKPESATSITVGGISFGIILAAANYLGWI